MINIAAGVYIGGCKTVEEAMRQAILTDNSDKEDL